MNNKNLLVYRNFKNIYTYNCTKLLVCKCSNSVFDIYLFIVHLSSKISSVLKSICSCCVVVLYLCDNI